MIPAAFDYVRAESPEHAVALLEQLGDDAKLLAGGHSLLPLMKLRLARPSVLVDVGRLDELRGIREEGDAISVGALARHHEVASSEVVRRSLPLLAHAASQVGDPQVRHRGTLGGSLAHGEPAGDLPAVALALGATLIVRGPDGERTVGIDELYTGFLETSLSPTEVITHVRFPVSAGPPAWSFQKFSRRAQDWAIVGVAAYRGHTDGSTRVALVNMGPTPLRGFAVEEALAAGADASEAAALAADSGDPPEDLDGSPEYRRHLARVLVGRALGELDHRAAGGSVSSGGTSGRGSGDGVTKGEGP